jgi:hypothetical protein
MYIECWRATDNRPECTMRPPGLDARIFWSTAASTPASAEVGAEVNRREPITAPRRERAPAADGRLRRKAIRQRM